MNAGVEHPCNRRMARSTNLGRIVCKPFTLVGFAVFASACNPSQAQPPSPAVPVAEQASVGPASTASPVAGATPSAEELLRAKRAVERGPMPGPPLPQEPVSPTAPPNGSETVPDR